MIAASMLLTAVLLSQAGSYHGQTTKTNPTKLTAGDQLYQGNLSGFRHYLNEVQQSDRELFLLLDPHLHEMENQQRLAWGVGLVGASAGVVMFGYGMYSGFAVIQSKTHDSAAFANALALGGGGVLVAVGSLTASVLLQPSSDQFLNLINRHNRARPEQPLRLQLGFAPVTRGHGGVAVAFTTF